MTIRHRRPAAALLAAFVLPLILAAGQASAASPWWQVSTSSRPTDLWLPKDELQELTKATAGATVIRIEGHNVACLAPTAASCLFTPPYAGTGTAAGLQSALEAGAAYGAGNVEVEESPAGSGRFTVAAAGAAAGRYLPPLTIAAGGNSGAAAQVLIGGGSGRLVLTLTNLGDAAVDGSAAPVRVADTLPQGVAAYSVRGFAGSNRSAIPCTLESTATVSCSFTGLLHPYEAIEVEIEASLTADPPASAGPGLVAVSGGNAPAASAAQPLRVSPEPTRFGIESYSLQAEEEGGAPATQAASHPFQLTTTLQLNQGPMVAGSEIEEQPGLPRNFRFELPAGLVGNATAVPRCSLDEFVSHHSVRADQEARTGFENDCPAASAVGVASVTIVEPLNFGLRRIAVPVFNLAPDRGEPARFGFFVANVPVLLDASVRTGDAYRVGIRVTDTPETAALLASTVSFWGVPGDPRHDNARGWECAYHFGATVRPCLRPEGLGARPLLRLPTSCQGGLGFPLEMEPWNVPFGAEVSAASFTGAALVGCDRVPFEPALELAPDTHAAASPSGLDVRLRVPQEASEAAAGLAEADVRRTTVTLPSELRLNPAAANGLQACSEAEVGFQRRDPASGEAVFSEAPASCPEAAKLGTVRIVTPLLDEPLTGAVYQAAQGANPFGSLLALYVVAEAPGAGVRVKLAGEVEAGPDGQLVSTFAATPQLPFEEFQLRFFGGAGAPLATGSCGSYRTEARIEPWSGASAATPASRFEVTSGPGGAPCRDVEPFGPSFAAGTESPLAGAFSPFSLRLARADGEQRLSRIETVLPAGLSGRLAGVPSCPDAAIHQAEGRDRPGEGGLEQASPSCPAASRVGTVRVGSGVGPRPVFVDGSAYLAGPYKGAPLSLAIVTPAVAGPFDLGTVVVRTALEVDDETLRITAKSDPLPTMLHGIPLDLRSVSLRLGRPGFTLNPTSCEATSLTGTASSAAGATAPLVSRFQVGECARLGFKPRLFLRLRGATKRGGHPALRAVLRPRRGDANIARLSVALPHSEFLAQSHIRTICTRVQFNAGAGGGSQCPAGSVYGHVRAWSPLVDYVLAGPVILRSSDNPLPDLVAVVRGPAEQPIVVAQVARIDSKNGGIRNTFESFPDVPIAKAILRLPAGRKSLLENSADICRAPHRARVSATAQNGRVRRFAQRLNVGGCGKAKRRGRSRHGRG